jgi:hypothetical protein
MGPDSRDGPGGLTPAARERLAALRSARSLADLVDRTGASDEHGAYFEAKAVWRDLRGRELAATGGPPPDGNDGLPGARVVVDGRTFRVHGITHAGTAAERSVLREHAAEWLDADAAVYCEQGVRSMYFEDFPAVGSMDDYRWAMAECRRLGIDSHVEDISVEGFTGLAEEVDSLAATFREAAFSLVHAGGDVYGERFRAALGDVAGAFLASHEDAATAEDFRSFVLSRRAARDPGLLGQLQRYYERSFLPQPVEREWLRRHDPELEVMTHARNERMADYALAYAGTAPTVHLIAGAAHQPGVRYYLEAVRDGRREPGYEPVE